MARVNDRRGPTPMLRFIAKTAVFPDLLSLCRKTRRPLMSKMHKDSAIHYHRCGTCMAAFIVQPGRRGGP